MNHVLSMLFIGIPVVLLSLFATPFVLARCLAPRASLAVSLVIAAVTALLLHATIPIALHVARIPITRFSLALIHLGLATAAGIAFRARGGTLWPAADGVSRRLRVLAAVFVATVLPFTCLAGIDTYKWLDLAMSLRVEQSIPWLVHPLSLLGFTGRSYPSLQPLLLGSVLILGELGVEWSFFAVSVLCGTLGIASAYLLGAAVHATRRGALWVALLYGFSPVFVRYNHWATGRGLLLALLPLFVLALVRLPARKGWGLLLLSGALLPLSHKAGLIALPAFLLSLAAVPLLPRRGERLLTPLAAVAAVAAAMVLAPNLGLPFPAGKALGFARMAVVRFGGLLPLAAAGLLFAPGWLSPPHRRRLLPATLLTFPFACTPDMYGALLALIFVALAASLGIVWIEERARAWRPRAARAITIASIVLVALGALAIVTHRSLNATPRRIKRAALFLERHDPQGPYRVVCTPWRPQIQGYVSGCPRFTLTRTGPVRVRLHLPPAPWGAPPHVVRAWVAQLRHLFSVTGFALDYYGKNPRRYYVVIDGRGARPENGERIYAEDNVEIFQPAGQTVPDPDRGMKQRELS